MYVLLVRRSDRIRTTFYTIASDMTSENSRKWAGEAGLKYTDRNPHTVDGLEELREEQYGVTQTELYEEILDDVDRDNKILEVGSNVGVQLRCLRNLGFENLYGLDIQSLAIEKSREYAPSIPAVVGDASRLPFKDETFDLVFTNGCLVTIPPELIDTVQAEITRCSKRYVFGQEFHADEYVAIESDHDDQLYWKTDFCDRYLENNDLELIESSFLSYVETDNVDRMFLLEKSG
ncbi:pseudaminic acid biosynthesis-associated methylase [Halosolutus amylolyticus]|uniref:Pseudaminic acid biosynthesis-associated methylase n=1 Tax=Halosolutus amylolyticus TaxID=2932267 RepID=A0ABD5PP56_9EURY|nr:pseudaminic acid biosynthesis-associated methylase [Halosolutus amylolyticus]